MKSILLLTVLFIGYNSFAQNKGDDVVIGQYDKIHSEILNEDRLLLISLPEGYRKTAIDYPVAYLFYGDRVMQYFSPTTTEIYNLSQDGFMPQMIIVGVGNNDRYRDFLPANRDGLNPGTENFLKFLREELFPYIEQKYRVKNSRFFIAPQASGALSLDVLTKDPKLFNACFMNNPFRWQYNRDFLMEKTINFFENNPDTKNYIYSSFILNDQFDEAGLHYIRKWKKIIDSLNLPNLILEINFQENSDDFVSSLELKTGLKRYFRDYMFPDSIKVNNLADIQKYYKDLSNKYGFEIDESDLVMTLKSDDLQNQGKVEESKEILNYILTKYPESLNAIWRLANIYREEGDTLKAIEFYKKSIEINPDMVPAKRWLEALEKKE